MIVKRLAVLLVLTASGCASLSPGLHMSESGLGDRPEAKGTKLQPITAKLLVAQAEERRHIARARPVDPLAATAGDYQYRVAPYDVLSVTVWDHPELTIPAGEYRAAEQAGNPVQADGFVFYPHVGVVQVAGKTVSEIRTVLTDRLRKVVMNPQLDVRVAAFRGKRFQVTGEVVQPSTLPIMDVPVRVVDAIASAKGLTPNAWTRDVTLSRGGKVYALDLQALYDDGDVSQNWLLQDGDVLNVPSREQNKVFVLGEVKKPSSKVMAKGRMSLAEAIGDSEGFDQTSANTGEVYVVRGRPDAPQVFKLDASSADALLLAVHFQLEPLDVVFVSPTKLTSWNRVMTQILPTLQGIWEAYDLAYRTQHW